MVNLDQPANFSLLTGIHRPTLSTNTSTIRGHHLEAGVEISNRQQTIRAIDKTEFDMKP